MERLDMSNARTGRPEGGGRDPDLDSTDPRWRLTATKYIVAVILLIAIVVPLLVPTYDQAEPQLFGFPFFYWYQLAWVFIAAGLCGLSYWLLKRERAAYLRAHPEQRPRPKGDAR
jgi:hypothetical protein